VVAFFAIFLVLLARPSIRKAGGCNEALAIALGLGSVICFAMMLMASYVHELEAMRLHATELLMLLGTAILLLVEGPAQPKTAEAAQQPPGELPLQQPQLLNNG
jgi:peptidoglycan/LPS O-acetylase OafA/YrhL